MTRMVSVLALLALALSVMWVPPEAQAGREVFRWRDAEGVTHFGDRPGAADARLAGAAAPAPVISRDGAPARPRHACRQEGAPAPGTAGYRELLMRWYENCR